MSDFNTFKALSLCLAACVAVFAVSACAIRLRDDPSEMKLTPPAAQESDAMAAELERCRTITFEQKDRLSECKKIWAEKRRQLFGHANGFSDNTGPLNPPSSSPTPPKDENRLPSGNSPAPQQGQ